MHTDGIIDEFNNFDYDSFKAVNNIMEEWNRYFPSCLGDLSKPQNISYKLSCQENEINRLKNIIETNQDLNKKDITSIKSDFKHQLNAINFTSMNDKENFHEIVNETISNYEKSLQKEKSNNELKLLNISENYDKKLLAIKSDFEV